MDVVVTLPKTFGIERWAEEGDAALPGKPSEPWTGRYYAYTVAGKPSVEIGERVYVVYDGALIGFAPLAALETEDGKRTALIRGPGACALTIDEHIPGFRGYRVRWWDRKDERPTGEQRGCRP